MKLDNKPNTLGLKLEPDSSDRILRESLLGGNIPRETLSFLKNWS